MKPTLNWDDVAVFVFDQAVDAATVDNCRSVAREMGAKAVEIRVIA